MAPKLTGNWIGQQNIPETQYACAYCGSVTASSTGWVFCRNGMNAQNELLGATISIRVCSFCKQPTYTCPGTQYPSPVYGESVRSLPLDVESLYSQARDCTGISAYTPTVLACRKILMHIAVDLKAKPGKNFLEYVDYLAEQGYVPPNGKQWVDHIRTKGNEANHEIVLTGKQDAEQLIDFVGLLLKFIYEFPNRVPKSPVVTPSP